MVKIVFLVFVVRAGKIALDGMKLHIHQPRGVVGPLQKSPQPQKVKGFVLQHGAGGDAARQMGLEFHPFKELARVALKRAAAQHADEFKVGLVLGFPDFGGQRAAHGARVFTGIAQARHDAGRIFFVAHHERHHVLRGDVFAVFCDVGRF